MMVTSLVPMWLVALQMYCPESCRPTLGKTRLLLTILCLQGSGERSFDQVIVGFGNPEINNTETHFLSVFLFIHQSGNELMFLVFNKDNIYIKSITILHLDSSYVTMRLKESPLSEPCQR